MQRFSLDKVITIEQHTGALDEYGNKKAGWTLLARTRARVLYISGTDTTEAQQLILVNTFDFLIRYRPVYTGEMRILYNGYMYKVIQSEHLTRKGFMRLRAEKKRPLRNHDFKLLSGDQLITMANETFKLQNSD